VTVSGDVRTAHVVATIADPAPTTRGRRDRLFAVLNAAQYLYEEKAKAWAIISSGPADADAFAELHALGLPDALVGAVLEQLAAR
jgi:hypothetical protein